MKGKNESEVIKRGAPEIIKSPAPFTAPTSAPTEVTAAPAGPPPVAAGHERGDPTEGQNASPT